ncbi:hypothetical protein GY45DRAFT_1249934 [Cubamyces sp. BRFM 1775]|nr:hypothetical protein GY45DRAFT_1249934 [Cubamyces sp. BRFM 1775]
MLPIYKLSFQCEAKDGPVQVQLAILACEDAEGRLPALIVSAEDSNWKALISGVVFQVPPSAPRYAGFRYSQSYPRMALLDPTSLRTAIGCHPERFAPQTICVPVQRIQAESQATVIKEPREAEASATFTCPCDILLPYWTMAHLRELGATTNADTEDGELKRVNVPSYPHPGSFSFRIHHGTQMVVVTVYYCPDARINGPLHVSVTRPDKEHTRISSWVKDAAVSEALVPGVCDGDHVDCWELGQKRFEGLEDEPCVALQFTVWDADAADGLTGRMGLDASHRPCYALDIRLEYPSRSSESLSSP